ncbi:MAG: hypothetical protein AAB884_02475 [Patescibacteria group bacterium]
MKPIYKIIGVLLIIVLVGLGIYLGWRKIIAPGPEEPAGNEPARGNITETKTENGLHLKKLSDNPVFGHWIYGGEIYYLDLDGKVFVAKDGADTEISKETFSALNNIEQSSGGSRILTSFGDPTNPSWGIFDSRDKAWRPLDSNILNAAWGGDDETLFVVVRNGSSLNLSEIDTQKNSSPKILIRDFRFKDIDILWKTPQTLLFLERPSAHYPGRLWQLDLKTLALNLLVAPLGGLIVQPSDDENIFFEFFSASREILILDSSFKPIVSEASFVTLPSKCAFFASTTYCFEPQEIPTNVTLPDDYLNKSFFSVDNLFTLNLETGELKRILTSGEGGLPAIDAKNPKVAGNSLFFINRYDDSLYELRFK